MADGKRWTTTGRSYSSAMTVSSVPPKSLPIGVSEPFAWRSVIASS